MLVFEDSQVVVSLGFFLGGTSNFGFCPSVYIVFSLIEAVVRFCYPRLPISQSDDSIHSFKLLKSESNNIKSA